MQDLAQITQISAEDILDFSSIIVQIILDDDDNAKDT